ncbi:succinate dehydrogenase/fumarate reductase iron-sulfur subunit, partial [bacterium]|nr:succinate dehydrogenase/fumarate reductase iron-sulfur subunit [bacterium]
MAEATFHVFRGEGGLGQNKEYKVPIEVGMVVLDA